MQVVKQLLDPLTTKWSDGLWEAVADHIISKHLMGKQFSRYDEYNLNELIIIYQIFTVAIHQQSLI